MNHYIIRLSVLLNVVNKRGRFNGSLETVGALCSIRSSVRASDRPLDRRFTRWTVSVRLLRIAADVENNRAYIRTNNRSQLFSVGSNRRGRRAIGFKVVGASTTVVAK